MSPRPPIFISAVSRELHSARQLVANTLTFLGYEPVWQDIFGTESGDLRALLRQKIDHCKGVVQLVGQCYGEEPSAADERFGRVSYTQYEALYARERGKKVWYLFMDEHFPSDACEGEPQEVRELQSSYRNRLRSDAHVFHHLTSAEGLEASVLKLRDDLTRLRRGVQRWAIGVAALLILIAGLIVWQLHSQAQMNSEMSKLRQALMKYPQMEARVRGSRSETDPKAIEERTYAQLGNQLAVDPKTLREKVPQVAEELRRGPDASIYERANANYVAKDYAQAERLALQAASKAEDMKPPNAKQIVEALELAGLSAQAAIRYEQAMEHFRLAEKFTNRSRDLQQWVTLQHEIANLLVVEGKYAEAQALFRSVIELRSGALGPEHPDTLDSRHRLIYALTRQSKYSEAEAEARQVLQLREKILGSESPETLDSRYSLADALVDQSKYTEGEMLYRQLVQTEEKLLGPEHPRTIVARLGLATALSGQGKSAEAEPLYREVIKLDEKVYGGNHPNTLIARQNLATALQADGNYGEAEAQYRDVISRQEKQVGAGHPDTLISRNNLAELLCDAGKYAEAEQECRQIIRPEENALGPENRTTLNTRGNLAVALLGQGKFDEAKMECRDVLQQMGRVLGFEHSDTLAYTVKLTTMLARQNKVEEAIELARGAAEGARNVLGWSNPATQKYAKLAQDLQPAH